jgi:hypothetical protein
MRDSRDDIEMQMLGLQIGLARLAASIREALPGFAGEWPARRRAASGARGQRRQEQRFRPGAAHRVR